VVVKKWVVCLCRPPLVSASCPPGDATKICIATRSFIFQDLRGGPRLTLLTPSLTSPAHLPTQLPTHQCCILRQLILQNGQHSHLCPLHSHSTLPSSAQDIVLTTVFFQSHDVHIRGCYYPALQLRPRQVQIDARQPCLQSALQRHPFPENHMGGNHLQNYVHNIRVTVAEGRHAYVFMLFFKRHRHFQPSQCIQALVGAQQAVLKSDIVIMRVGTKASYVNMRGRDSVLADWVIKR